MDPAKVKKNAIQKAKGAVQAAKKRKKAEVKGSASHSQSSSSSAPRNVSGGAISSDKLAAAAPAGSMLASNPSAAAAAGLKAAAAAASGNTTSLQSTPGTSNPASEPEEEEDFEDYCPGGYHPVKLNETYKSGRYVTVRKLGWGHFSTVWLALDTEKQRHVALKVVRSAAHYTETAIDEIKLCQCVAEANPDHPGYAHVVGLLDQFEHEGPNGRHVCMVFEVLGENLLGLIRRYEHRGIPINVVKQIARQILLALDYLHRECGIIHTDLKPENVLIAIEDVEEVAKAAAQQTALEMRLPPGLSGGGGGSARRPRYSRIITGSQPLPSPAGSIHLKASSYIGSNSNGSPVTRDTSQVKHASNLGPNASKDVSMSGTSPAKSQTPPSITRQRTDDHITSHVSSISLESQSGSPSGGGHSSSQTADSPPMTHMTASGESLTAAPHGVQTPAPKLEGPRVVSNLLPSSSKLPNLDLSRITVKIADLGNACWTHHHFTNDIQTRQYRSPEVILGAKWGASADLWSFACMIFELLTGDYLFDPKSGKSYDKDDDHMAQIMELLGTLPKHLALSGRFSNELFNRKGVLRKIDKLNMWSLVDVLHDKYHLSWNDSEALSNFLSPMLQTDPHHRATAQKQLHDPWAYDPDLDVDKQVGLGPTSGAKHNADNDEETPGSNGTQSIPGWAAETRERRR
ncbi:serine/threonine protein kinase, CMGC [Savitreella phatthalungensis]